MLITWLSLAAVALTLLIIGVVSLTRTATLAEIEPTTQSNADPTSVVPSAIAKPAATPSPSVQTSEPPAAASPAPAPVAPSCPTGSVNFAVYDANLAPLYDAAGNVSGYSATVVVAAANRTSQAVQLRSGSGAWGLDAAGARIVPVAVSWSAQTINPGTQVAATGQNTIVTIEQAAAVVSWSANATGYAVADGATAPPAGCSPRPAITG